MTGQIRALDELWRTASSGLEYMSTYAGYLATLMEQLDTRALESAATLLDHGDKQ